MQEVHARAEVLAALEAVDLVVVFDQDTPLELIRRVRPKVLVKGGDYRREQVVGHELVEADGGEVILIDLVPGFSTTRIVRKSRARSGDAEARGCAHRLARSDASRSSCRISSAARAPASSSRSAPIGRSRNRRPGTSSSSAGPACSSSRSPISPPSCARKRSAKVFAVACSSPQNAGRRMRLHVAGALSSLDRDRMAPGAEPESVIEVPVRTLDDVLIEARAPVPLDFLSIDVEGHELEVLSGFDLARWRPRLILLEDHVGNLEKHRFLENAGYRLIRRVENNGWYVPRDAASAVGPRERWEIVRKYYLALPFRMARNASRAVRRRIRAWLTARRFR